jgi:23S rRNA-/tRNA-specific pseudouridylate synthase
VSLCFLLRWHNLLHERTAGAAANQADAYFSAGSLLLQGGELDKVYLARVSGTFPEQPLTVDVPLLWDPKRNEATAAPGAAASNARPTLGAVKSAVTLFRRLSVAADGATSLVECR